MRFAVLFLLLVLVGGCNLYSPFYDEGKSDDLDDIKGDVQAALERGEPDKAYEYAVRGIKKHPDCVSLYYLGAVAKVQDADVGFTDFASMLRGEDGGSDLALGRPPLYWSVAAGETTFFLDLSPEKLATMAMAFNTSYDLLEEAADLVAQGKATPEELEDFEGDIQLGLGISGLLTAILTVLDYSHDLDDEDGFVLNPLIKAYEFEGGGWAFTATVDPSDICKSMPWLVVAQEALYDHYRGVVGGDLPADIPSGYQFIKTEFWTDPTIDTGTVTGEFFANVHDGIVSFHEKYSCSTEVRSHE